MILTRRHAKSSEQTWTYKLCTQVPALLFTSPATLSKELDFLGSQFPHLKNGDGVPYLSCSFLSRMLYGSNYRL